MTTPKKKAPAKKAAANNALVTDQEQDQDQDQEQEQEGAKPTKGQSRQCSRNFRHKGSLYERGKVYDVPAALLKRFPTRFTDPKADL